MNNSECKRERFETEMVECKSQFGDNGIERERKVKQVDRRKNWMRKRQTDRVER